LCLVLVGLVLFSECKVSLFVFSMYLVNPSEESRCAEGDDPWNTRCLRQLALSALDSRALDLVPALGDICRLCQRHNQTPKEWCGKCQQAGASFMSLCTRKTFSRQHSEVSATPFTLTAPKTRLSASY